jgi:coenzyme F420-0:L-glutamate ligase/coenzyme F420-1:gamma-L-glutamate ligase
MPEIRTGDDLARIIHESAVRGGTLLADGDVLVVAQKVVSKAEGRVFQKERIHPSPFARRVAAYTGHDPEYAEVVLRSSRRIVRMANGFVIAQTHHGQVMANAGVDSSNAGGADLIVALPEDPDASARRIRDTLRGLTGLRLGIIISDTFGRPWRCGQVNVAIGVAGLKATLDYRGRMDDDGRILRVTQIAVVDELASAAELVMGKTRRLPVVVVRGCTCETGPGSARDLVRDEEHDIFK